MCIRFVDRGARSLEGRYCDWVLASLPLDLKSVLFSASLVLVKIWRISEPELRVQGVLERLCSSSLQYHHLLPWCTFSFARCKAAVIDHVLHWGKTGTERWNDFPGVTQRVYSRPQKNTGLLCVAQKVWEQFATHTACASYYCNWKLAVCPYRTSGNNSTAQWVSLPLLFMSGRSPCFLENSRCLLCFVPLSFGERWWWVVGSGWLLLLFSAPCSSPLPQSAHFVGGSQAMSVTPPEEGQWKVI